MDGVSHLLSLEGRQVLASLPPYDAADADRLSKELRGAGVPPDVVAAALTQQRLRSRATAKFGADAARMFFTEAGAQQATRAVVADHHARRFVMAGCRDVVDLTSGIGADSLALARAGLNVTANDFDQTTAACAELNLAPFPNARVTCEDALHVDLSAFDGAFVDPARRSSRGRTFDPAGYSPPFDSVLALRFQVPALGVKVAPGIAHSDLPEDTHAQWVSVDGDVVEAGLWFGPLAEGPGRSALVISAGQSEVVEAADDPRLPVVPVQPGPLGRYVYQPDGAVIRSGGLSEIARRLEAAPVSDQIAYLTGDLLVSTPLAQAFEVVDAMPIKQLSGYLRQRDVGSLEILKRGVDVVPDRFRKKLKLRGNKSATVILTRLQGRHSAIVVRRLPPELQLSARS